MPSGNYFLSSVRGTPFFAKTYYYGFSVACFSIANVIRTSAFYGTGQHSVFQADYAIPVIMLALMQRLSISRALSASFTFLVSLLVIANDAVLIFARRFRWGPDALPQYIASSNDLPWLIIVPILQVIILASAVFCVALTWNYRRKFAIAPLIIFIAALQCVDMRFGTSRFKDNTSGIDVITTSVLSTFPIYASYASGASLKNTHQESMARMLLRDTQAPSQILSVSIESLGFARTPTDRAALLAPLMRHLGGLYRIEQRSHDFYGATLQGEIRELCGARLTGNASERPILRSLRRCLPMRLRERGYDTQALHGNGGRFYARYAVYPAMGFRRSWFYDAIVASDPTAAPCANTAFTAVCDSKLYSRALSLFDGKKRFVHVMTLDTHLPVPDRGDRSCDRATIGDAALCRYTGLIQKSLSELGSTIAASRFKPDVIFLYGDHAPPFSDASAREQFSAQSVPFIILRRVHRDDQ